MHIRSTVFAFAMALLAAPLLGACGSDPAPAASAYVVVADASGSANKIDLMTDAKKVFTQRIAAMAAPSTVSFMIFNTDVGSSTCPPLEVSLAWSDNSTAIDDTRNSYAQVAPAKADEYVQCALGNPHGTDLFGGIANAATLLDGVKGTRAIDLLTDGCNTTIVGGIQARTCGPNITDPKWREQLLKALPPELTPNLAGVSITVTGLARGAGIPSQRVLSLREFWTEYAKQVGATITFNS